MKKKFEDLSLLDQKKKLKKWFPTLELDMIETSFERRVIVDSNAKLQTKKHIYSSIFLDYVISTKFTNTDLAKRCIAFGRQYKKASDRLLAILENILENKGIFTP